MIVRCSSWSSRPAYCFNLSAILFVLVNVLFKVDMISELSKKPNCFFQQQKQSKNSALVTVHVPKSTEVLILVYKITNFNEFVKNSSAVHEYKY